MSLIFLGTVNWPFALISPVIVFMAFTFNTDILISEYQNSEFHASIYFCLLPVSFLALATCGSLLSAAGCRLAAVSPSRSAALPCNLRLVARLFVKGKDLTPIFSPRLLEKANPCFRERKVESLYPGYLLCQDTFLVGTLKGIGRIYMQAVVDTYGSFAFGKLYTSKLPETAVDVLYDRVLPFYEAQGLAVERILTDNGREYCGRPMIHPYQIFLEFSDIEHRRTKAARPRTNGFVERFNRTVLDEFFRETFREKFYASVEELQVDLDQWLHHYNYERPHRGYRNMGRRPI